MTLTLVSLFDGIGGFPLAFERAGARTVATVEIDESAAAVSRRHFPNAVQFRDVTEVSADDFSALVAFSHTAGIDPQCSESVTPTQPNRGTPVSFEAKYPGRCAAESCNYGDSRIREGDDVEYHDDELMHRECANSTRKGDPPLCKACFTHHRGECL